MGIAEHAAFLEGQSGRALTDFTYSDTDYARVRSLIGLEKLRGVRDPALRRTCWALYWICEASGGAHPEAPRAELEEWDGTWTRGEDLLEQDRAAAREGLTRDGVSGLLTSDWAGFERKLGIWSAKMFREAGVSVSDAQKAQHRRAFHQILRKKYGRSEAPARSPE